MKKTYLIVSTLFVLFFGFGLFMSPNKSEACWLNCYGGHDDFYVSSYDYGYGYGSFTYGPGYHSYPTSYPNYSSNYAYSSHNIYPSYLNNYGYFNYGGDYPVVNHYHDNVSSEYSDYYYRGRR